jgi:formamidopyrimidine-DNA glycosylase
MPELPEVETIVRDLRPQLEGRRVESAFAAVPGILRHPDAETFARRLPGRVLTHVGRHGKFIQVDLDDGELLVIHLGMTGRLGLAEPEEPPAPHTHIRLGLSSGLELRMQDYRRFGRVLLGSRADMLAARLLPRLGPEPYAGGVSPRAFSAILRRSHRPLKALLLDQAALAGLGNIYCDEACFRAGVRPTAMASRIGPARRRRLLHAIDEALASAVNLRGSSIDDYRDGFGEKGQNQHSLLVYGRGGKPCTRCGRILEQLRLAGRTTVFCRRCQR